MAWTINISIQHQKAENVKFIDSNWNLIPFYSSLTNTCDEREKIPTVQTLQMYGPKLVPTIFGTAIIFAFSLCECAASHICVLNIFEWDIHIRMRAGNHLNTNKPFNFQPFKRSENY